MSTTTTIRPIIECAQGSMEDLDAIETGEPVIVVRRGWDLERPARGGGRWSGRMDEVAAYRDRQAVYQQHSREERWSEEEIERQVERARAALDRTGPRGTSQRYRRPNGTVWTRMERDWYPGATPQVVWIDPSSHRYVAGAEHWAQCEEELKDGRLTPVD